MVTASPTFIRWVFDPSKNGNACLALANSSPPSSLIALSTPPPGNPVVFAELTIASVSHDGSDPWLMVITTSLWSCITAMMRRPNLVSPWFMRPTRDLASLHWCECTGVLLGSLLNRRSLLCGLFPSDCWSSCVLVSVLCGSAGIFKFTGGPFRSGLFPGDIPSSYSLVDVTTMVPCCIPPLS